MQKAKYKFFELCTDDIPVLEELDAQCFERNRRFTQGYFHLLFLYDDAFGWGLKSGQSTVAFILLTQKNNRVNIATIDVHPNHRRKGLASRLIADTMRILKSHGLSKISLQVETTNEGAIRLYESFGFQTIRSLPAYYQDGDAYQMEKKL